MLSRYPLAAAAAAFAGAAAAAAAGVVAATVAAVVPNVADVRLLRMLLLLCISDSDNGFVVSDSNGCITVTYFLQLSYDNWQFANA